MEYNCFATLLVSAAQQRESAIIIHLSPPSWASPSKPHPTSLGHHRARAEPPMLHSYPTSFLFYTCVCAHMCAQSCPTFCNPIVWELPGSFLHGIFQARTVEWFAISYSRGSSQPRDQTHASCVSCLGNHVLHHCATWVVHICQCYSLSSPCHLFSAHMSTSPFSTSVCLFMSCK